MLPVIAKVNLSLHDCYAYYATAANLNKLYQPVKSLAAQISIAICIPIHCKERICVHMDFWYIH